MKTKLYLLAICTSMICTGSVLGEPCPDVPIGYGSDGSTPEIGNNWQFAEWKGGHTAGKNDEYELRNAWLYDIYDVVKKKFPKCHYALKGTNENVLSFKKLDPEMTTVTYDLQPNNGPDLKNQGLHCVPKSMPKECMFTPK